MQGLFQRIGTTFEVTKEKDSFGATFFKKNILPRIF